MMGLWRAIWLKRIGSEIEKAGTDKQKAVAKGSLNNSIVDFLHLYSGQ